MTSCEVDVAVVTSNPADNVHTSTQKFYVLARKKYLLGLFPQSKSMKNAITKILHASKIL